MSDTFDLKRRLLLQLVTLAPFAWHLARWLVRPSEALASDAAERSGQLSHPRKRSPT